MAYTPFNWVAGVSPLSEFNMDHLETQYDEAAADIATHAALTAAHGASEVADTVDLRQKLKPPTVRWSLPGWRWDLSSGQAVTANRIYYIPIYVEEDTTYIRIGCNVTIGDGAGGVADLRIFEWSSGVPGDLVLSAGTVSTNGAALKEITISEALARGWHFLAVRCDQTPSLISPNSSVAGATSPVSGISLTGNMTHDLCILYDDAAYTDPAGTMDGTLDADFALMTLREN